MTASAGPDAPASRAQAASPAVSVGVPVRNGANGLAAALDSLLAQDFQDLEIVISDNASDDETPEICRRYAAADPRIRYIRQTELLPVMENFGFVLAEARAPLFMWAAHDDVRPPDFLSVLTTALAGRPDAVLAYGDSIEIVDGTDHLRDFDFETTGLSTWQRMAKTAAIQCFHIYGLWRTEALRRIPMVSIAWWPDTPIMLAAAALGPFVYAPGPRLRYRFNPRPFVTWTARPGLAGRLAHIGRLLRRSLILLELVYRSFLTVSVVAGPLRGLAAGWLALRKVAGQIAGNLGRR